MYKYASGNYYERKLGHIALLKKLPQKINNNLEDALSPFELTLWITPPRRKESEEKITLKDFFSPKESNGTRGYVDLVVVCYDGFFSSARRVKTIRYTMDSIVYNAFFEKGSIIPTQLPISNNALMHNDYHY